MWHQEQQDEFLNEYGQIRPDKIDDLMVEVVSGRHLFTLSDHPFTLYASRCPTPKEQDEARIVYVKTVRQAKLKGLLSKADLEQVAMEKDLFKRDERTEKNSLIQLLERQQRAKDRSMSPAQKVQIVTEMEISRRRIIEIEMSEHEILKHSAEIFSEETRISYLVACCTMGGEMLNEPIWNGWADFQLCAEWGLVNDARRAFMQVSTGLPTKIIRALARCGEWRIRWKSAKESGTTPFEGSGSNWDKNKVNLIYWSDFYDNIYQHPEAPDEATICNDDHLQEWLNGQLAKRQASNNSNGSHGNRPSPTYKDGTGRRRVMNRLGGDKTIKIGTPYKVRV